jgi:hypothetical protein
MPRSYRTATVGVVLQALRYRPLTRNVPDAYAEYIARRERDCDRPKSLTWAIIRQILIGVTLALAYASFAIPIVGGFISVPFFVIAGILTWRRDWAMP